jgi:hypothetical protein
MAKSPEGLHMPARVGVGAAFALSSLVAGVVAAEQQPERQEIVLEMQSPEEGTIQALSVGEAVLAETCEFLGVDEQSGQDCELPELPDDIEPLIPSLPDPSDIVPEVSELPLPAVPITASRPDHCADYDNMEKGIGHPENQDWFNHLEVRTGEKGYPRLRAACVYGWGTEEWGALDELWRLEADGDDPRNGNDWHETNIPQAKPFSKMQCAATDHRCQARWGLQYIKDRYGSPIAALKAWRSRFPHWY